VTPRQRSNVTRVLRRIDRDLNKLFRNRAESHFYTHRSPYARIVRDDSLCGTLGIVFSDWSLFHTWYSCTPFDGTLTIASATSFALGHEATTAGGALALAHVQ
jgi:hypothetical protein